MLSKSIKIATIGLNAIGFLILLLFILDDTEVLEISSQPLKYFTHFGFVFFIPILIIWHFYIHRSKNVKTISAIIFGGFIILLFGYYNPIGILNESGVWKTKTISYLNEKDSSRVIVIQERKSMGTRAVFGRKYRMTELLYSGALFMRTKGLTQKILEQKEWMKRIEFDKIEYFVDGCACDNGSCPTFHLIIEKNKNVFLASEKYYSSGIPDSTQIGNFFGSLEDSTYQNIISELSRARIEDSTFSNSSCCDDLKQKMIVSDNGKKFVIEQTYSQADEKLKHLFSILLKIPNQIEFKFLTTKFPSQEIYKPCWPPAVPLKQFRIKAK